MCACSGFIKDTMRENFSSIPLSQSSSLSVSIHGLGETGGHNELDGLANIKIPALAKDTTPMMAQYIEIKAANPDCLLFYRMGDFYELFFADAEIASRALGITLTKRGKHNGEDIPMCGVPVHAAQDYLKKLITLKYRVAVCEQTEDPKQAKKRGPKAVVRREVERLVTAGTILDDGLLAPQRSNFLASVALSQTDTGLVGLAYADISTGELYVTDCMPDGLQDSLAQIEAAELICPQKLVTQFALEGLLAQSETVLAPLSAQASVLDDLDKIISHYARSIGADWTWSKLLAHSTKLALAQLLSYIDRTQYGGNPHLARIQTQLQSPPVQIDMATRRSLELTRTQIGETKGSLLHAIDRTQTAQGRRMLNQRINAPITDIKILDKRLDQVEHLHLDTVLLAQLRDGLRKCPDHARVLTRLEVGRGGPKDLKNLVSGLLQTSHVTQLLMQALDANASPDGQQNATPVFAQILAHMNFPDQGLLVQINDALQDQCPILVNAGAFIKDGVDLALDEARHLKTNSQSIIASLQQSYRDDLGVGALKIKFNNVWGYFVEVPSTHGEKLLQNEQFFHKQTLANAMRFTCAKLQELESEIAEADHTIQEREKSLFEAFCAQLLNHNKAIKQCDRALAELDIAASHAQLAIEQEYCRPILDNSFAFQIVKGRHPVVEQALKKAQNQSFVANDCDLTAHQSHPRKAEIWLVTGPNMGGKSTFLRQNAIIAILAQMGCFVPADKAHIGVADKIFSRVGASDDLAGGRSTFMVEMNETAQILNHATEKSLVILDEIGRGTATFDGLSIAWATLEHIHDVNKSRAVFATHYHELTALASQYTGIENYALKVSEYEGDVVFLHELEKGRADRSYGIQVAQLAGLPLAVIARARLILNELEQSNRTDISQLVDALPLFQTMSAVQVLQTEQDPLVAYLNALNADELTPKQALEELYTLIRMAKNKG